MTAIEFNNVSKQYRLGQVSTGALAHDLNRENNYMNGSIMGMRKYEIDRKLDEIVHHPKQGFSLPLDKDCREGLKEELESFVRTGGTGLFKQPEIASIWQRYLSGQVSWMRIRHLFVVDDWCRRNKIEL